MSQTGDSFGLGKIDAGLNTLRTMIVNIGFFIAMLLLIPTMGAQVVRNPIVIEPIAVPQALIDRGMTASVAANRVWDGLQDFSRDAAIARQSFIAIPDSQLVEFALPGSGLSINSILKQLRQFFGSDETRIAGEIICQTSDCAIEGQRLRLRVVSTGVTIIDMPPIGTTPVSVYFREAAAGVYDVLDPLIAAAAGAVNDREGARARALRLATTPGPDAKWAHVLLGDLALGDGQTEDAKQHYLAALVDDASFFEARIGLVRSAIALQNYADASAGLAQLPQQGEVAATVFRLQSNLAAAQGQLDEARDWAQKAADAAPLSADPQVLLGQLALDADDAEAARTAFTEALAIDPGNPEALEALGTMERAEGNLDAAEALVRDWVDYAPTDVNALRALVAVRLERGDNEGAAEAYESQTALAPLTDDEALERAEILRNLRRYAEAGDIIDHLVTPDIPLPAAVLLRARLHDEAGRGDRALPLYERYLTLGEDLPERTVASEAIARLSQ